MIYEIKMPSLGADMEQGKLLNWRIHVRDSIEKGQTIADVETQKAAVEIESFKKGRVTKIIAKEGEIIPVGQTIAELEVEDQIPKVDSKIKTDINPKTEITPKTDATFAANSNSIREAIAKAMVKSKKEIPHYYLTTSIEIDELLGWLDQENAKRSMADRILISALFLKALALAIKKYPEMNGFYVDEKFNNSQSININLAISLKAGGVMVPALLNVESKSLDRVNQEIKDLIERTREFKIKQKELTDGTITITMLGDLGVEEVTGIIFPPQVALLGIGTPHKVPWVKNKAIVIANIIRVTLAADHRVSDGIVGSKFLLEFKRALSELIKDNSLG